MTETNGKAFDPRKASLGEILVRVGVISEKQLAEALEQTDPQQKNLGQVLVALGHTTEDKIMKAVGIRLGIAYFTSFEGLLEAGAAQLVPEALARRHLAVPVYRMDDVLTVGMVNPVDINAVDELARVSGLKIQPVMTTLSNLFSTIQRVYSAAPSAAPAPAPAKDASTRPALRDAKDKIVRFQAEDRSVVEMVNTLLQEGMSRKASDIHLEPEDDSLQVRFRVDGMLQEGKSFQKSQEPAVIARIKILSKLDITETRLPQDGRMRFEYGGRKIDLRISTLPTVHGEKLVARILDSTVALKKIPDLGLSDGVRRALEGAIRRPNGIVLVTGPTGSGKTTTLYSALAALNERTRNIVTLENPVEYRLRGINQVETHEKIGLTFAAGLRSVLRQDPNVVLVGEIRDLETAEIAIQAAITGHLVFSTLHTNDAVSAVHRLLNMWAEPFLVAGALGGVLAQRLVRRLCGRCKAKHDPTPAEREALQGALPKGASFYAAAGCGECFQTGYAGRLGVHEWFAVTRNSRELILRRASTDELRAQARKDGMRTLQEDALAKAQAGETSIEEVLRVTLEEAEA